MSCSTSHVPRLERREQISFDAAEQRAHRTGDVLARLLPRVEARQAQQVAHQPLHPHGVARDDLEKAARRGGVGAAVEQRFDVAPHRRERCAQLVRDVGHEVPAYAIGAAQLGDVVQHDDGAGRSLGAHRGAAHRHDDAVRQRQFEALAFLAAAERRADLRGDVRVADDLEVVAPFRLVLQPQHPLRGAVGQLHVPLGVDDEDPFGHPAENGLHAGAIRGELLRPAPDVANRLVEHARHRPDLVGAVIPRRA